MKKPDISILSDEFLAEVQGMEHKNLQVELLRCYGYKPAECETLVVMIMEQAESLYRDWPEAA